ncbi:MAG: 3-phosphoshikimate 1-carboxyvinyltransferase [Deltaproteobacteria bacterium]|nr:MAG: 3-phosphoshikimate 1-carboxyvinyltransferase [Deltaproteobacteria bacterium]
MQSVRTVRPATAALAGTARVPGDKSIGHRAVLFNAAAGGRARIAGLPEGADVMSTVAAVRELGAGVRREGDVWVIEGCGLEFRPPRGVIDCGNSGTTMRLMMGLLAGQKFSAGLDGDASLRRRPMERVAAPLRRMGARVETTDGHAPVRVGGGSGLRGVRHDLEIASAQVKTALLLAGLQAGGVTTVCEPLLSRDHTERMLGAMGVRIERVERTVSLEGPIVPRASDVNIPGDPSSAAFLLAAAALVPDSKVTVEGVCLNPTRTAFLEVLKRMGAAIEVRRKGESGGEPVGDVCCTFAALRGVEIEPEQVPSLIDEIPILAVVAASARGRTVVRGAGELRVKESDRISATVALLAALGVRAEELPDGMVIDGGRFVGGTLVDSHGDHRIAMAAAVAALACKEPIDVAGAQSVAVSYPGFFEQLEELGR